MWDFLFGDWFYFISSSFRAPLQLLYRYSFWGSQQERSRINLPEGRVNFSTLGCLFLSFLCCFMVLCFNSADEGSNELRWFNNSIADILRLFTESLFACVCVHFWTCSSVYITCTLQCQPCPSGLPSPGSCSLHWVTFLGRALGQSSCLVPPQQQLKKNLFPLPGPQSLTAHAITQWHSFIYYCTPNPHPSFTLYNHHWFWYTGQRLQLILTYFTYYEKKLTQQFTERRKVWRDIDTGSSL